MDHVGKALLPLADSKKFQGRRTGKALSSTKWGALPGAGSENLLLEGDMRF